MDITCKTLCSVVHSQKLLEEDSLDSGLLGILICYIKVYLTNNFFQYPTDTWVVQHPLTAGREASMCLTMWDLALLETFQNS